MVRKAARDMAAAAYKWARQAYIDVAHDRKPFKPSKPWNARLAPAAHVKSERVTLTWQQMQDEFLIERLFPRMSGAN